MSLTAAARLAGIDHRRIWLWAEQGLIRHVEVESSDGRRKTYYVLDDVLRLASDRADTPDYPQRARVAALLVDLLSEVKEGGLSAAISRTA